MLSPESPDGVHQKIEGNWGKCNEDCDRCVESCNIFLNERYEACNEKGIDTRNLVVEHVFHAFRGMKYEDGWWKGS